MYNKSMHVGAIIACVLFSYSANSLSAGNFPTLCNNDEVAYLNAKMQKVIKNDKAHLSEGYVKFVKTDKILSLCADKNKEPLGKLVYRYGSVGKVEMERIATATDKFNIYAVSEGRMGNNVLFFSSGKINYYVTEALGMGTGVALMVFDSGKKVLDLFSGNDADTDYESGMFEINFDKAASPIFKRKKPVDKLDF